MGNLERDGRRPQGKRGPEGLRAAASPKEKAQAIIEAVRLLGTDANRENVSELVGRQLGLGPGTVGAFIGLWPVKGIEGLKRPECFDKKGPDRDRGLQKETDTPKSELTRRICLDAVRSFWSEGVSRPSEEQLATRLEITPDVLDEFLKLNPDFSGKWLRKEGTS